MSAIATSYPPSSSNGNVDDFGDAMSDGGRARPSSTTATPPSREQVANMIDSIRSILGTASPLKSLHVHQLPLIPPRADGASVAVTPIEAAVAPVTAPMSPATAASFWSHHELNSSVHGNPKTPAHEPDVVATSNFGDAMMAQPDVSASASSSVGVVPMDAASTVPMPVPVAAVVAVAEPPTDVRPPLVATMSMVTTLPLLAVPPATVERIATTVTMAVVPAPVPVSAPIPAPAVASASDSPSITAMSAAMALTTISREPAANTVAREPTAAEYRAPVGAMFDTYVMESGFTVTGKPVTSEHVPSTMHVVETLCVRKPLGVTDVHNTNWIVPCVMITQNQYDTRHLWGQKEIRELIASKTITLEHLLYCGIEKRCGVSYGKGSLAKDESLSVTFAKPPSFRFMVKLMVVGKPVVNGMASHQPHVVPLSAFEGTKFFIDSEERLEECRSSGHWWDTVVASCGREIPVPKFFPMAVFDTTKNFFPCGITDDAINAKFVPQVFAPSSGKPDKRITSFEVGVADDQAKRFASIVGPTYDTKTWVVVSLLKALEIARRENPMTNADSDYDEDLPTPVASPKGKGKKPVASAGSKRKRAVTSAPAAKTSVKATKASVSSSPAASASASASGSGSGGAAAGKKPVVVATTPVEVKRLAKDDERPSVNDVTLEYALSAYYCLDPFLQKALAFLADLGPAGSSDRNDFTTVAAALGCNLKLRKAFNATVGFKSD